MIIMKFGGTSVNSGEKIKTIAALVNKYLSEDPIVVVSALRGVTDMLLEVNSRERITTLNRITQMHLSVAREIWGENVPEKVEQYINSCIKEIKSILRKRKLGNARTDAVIAYGEIMSSFLVSSALEYLNIFSTQVIATNLIVTNDRFGSAEFLPEETIKQTKKTITPLLKKRIVPVVTGFVGATKSGKTTTLGRGGSDYTASIIGFALGANEIQIWTDVDGIYSADPRQVKNAKHLAQVSYREASELAAFGAKVLHPSTIRPAVKKRIPVRVLSTLQPENTGTLIVDSVTQGVVAGVVSKKDITLINITSEDMLFQYGFLEKIFSVFARYTISVDLVSVSEISVSVTLDTEENLANALKELSGFTTVSVTRDVGIVSLIGEGIVRIPHVVKHVFNLLDKESITPKMISLGATDINISLVVQALQVDQTVQALHTSMLPLMEKRIGEIV